VRAERRCVNERAEPRCSEPGVARGWETKTRAATVVKSAERRCAIRQPNPGRTREPGRNQKYAVR